jgi:hypothetical protein
MVAVPLPCAEQEVRLIHEDFSPQAQIDKRVLPTGEAQQMLVYIPQLGGGEEAQAIATFEVTTRTILPPTETSSLVIAARPPKELKLYLGASPFINTRHRNIRAAVKEAWESLEAGGDARATQDPQHEGSQGEHDQGAAPNAAPPDSTPADAAPADVTEPPTDWQRVEALYDYVLDHVEYVEGDDMSAIECLARGTGDCQAIGALFVAMCRTAEIPARLVWVHDHQYAEFYLEDADGEGRWYPVETAGQRAFGEMPVARVILQKGDSFRVPERRKERLRYASDYAMFLATPQAKPVIKYVRVVQ